MAAVLELELLLETLEPVDEDGTTVREVEVVLTTALLLLLPPIARLHRPR